MLRRHGDGHHVLGVHEEGRGHHAQRCDHVPGEQQHQHHRRTHGHDGRILGLGRPTGRGKRGQLRHHLPSPARGVRTGSGRPCGAADNGGSLLPGTLFRGPDVDDIHRRALREELRRPRVRPRVVGGPNGTGHLPLRPPQCRAMDQDGPYNGRPLPAVPGGPGPHLGLRADVQRPFHGIHDLELRVVQVQGMEGRERGRGIQLPRLPGPRGLLLP